MNQETFEDILSTNIERIHYHIHKLNIYDATGEFFAEGQVALWQAYLTYDQEKSSFSTYANWKIRNALVDYLRKQGRSQEKEELYLRKVVVEETYVMEDSLVDDDLWIQVKSLLSDNQWKWVQYFIIRDYSIEQIAALEEVSKDAVKNWGRHARNKLKANLTLEL
ncbi:sigma-70 family RNA polymerase sigma factor [Halobacillus litoralis]|uniref:sigma-70 family RNA polymerase sigma factor n=1 Tax=Halobacillus litoralis TaxID=45668 RepID=UPI001CD44497|nr:sigma-70 family RNA polymerase sigma factor [Halobacillus litoralis]MCA0971534.1 sigma-70 family RNA polymerase sigma factor [Halobacillus litoralis]